MALSAGDYLGKVVEQETENGLLVAKFGKSQTKGTPQITILIEVTSGARIGEQMDWTGYFSGGALDRTLQSLRCMGFTGDDLDTFNDQRPTAEFSFTVGEEEYKGKTRAKIQWINAPNRSFTKDDLKALSEEIKPKLAQFQPLAEDDQLLF